jgi:hypothetical protein
MICQLNYHGLQVFQLPNIEKDVIKINKGNNKEKNIHEQERENQRLAQSSNDELYFQNNKNYFPSVESSKRPTPYPNNVKPYKKIQPYANKVQFQSLNHKQNKPFVNKFKPFRPFNKNQNRNKLQNFKQFPSPSRFPSLPLNSPPRRSQKKPKTVGLPRENNKNVPKVNFQFVEDLSNIPQKKPVKRFQQLSPSNAKNTINKNTSSTNSNGGKNTQGIIELLKSHDLTVMAALLE